jgi:hypothetical protein
LHLKVKIRVNCKKLDYNPICCQIAMEMMMAWRKEADKRDNARRRGPRGLRAGLPNRRAMGKLHAAYLDDKDSTACPHPQTRVIATARSRSQAPGRARVGG